MRIRDWSSDVCSSDLGAEDAVQVAAVVVLQLELLAGLVLVHRHQPVAKLVLGSIDVDERMRLELAIRTDALEQPLAVDVPLPRPRAADRQSVGSGKSVAVRVDLGGPRFTQKKT